MTHATQPFERPGLCCIGVQDWYFADKKYGEHSALNMFTEYSMDNPRELAEFIGFTESEIKSFCETYNLSFEETKKWYNGYQGNGHSIYNLYAVIQAILQNEFRNYWTKTETYEA